MLKRAHPIIFLPMLFMAACATQQKCTKSQKCPTASIRHVRTTAYTHTEAGGRHSAIGTRLRGADGEVKTAAADWSRFPLGTKFKILSTGEVYQVDDYGSALVGKNTIDLYKPSRNAMRKWGARHEDIQILEWGSPVKSLQVLAPRAHHAHVREMLADLRQQS